MPTRLAVPCLVLSAALLCAGCSSDDAPGCLIGESRACACTDGRSGAQVCGADGTLGPCVCSGTGLDAGLPPVDAGSGDAGLPPADAGEDAGAPPADAGSLDAGTADAGTFDAGGFDAGIEPGDGGEGSDAGWPARRQDYQASAVTYLSEQRVPPRDDGTGEYTCCHDFDGDGVPDNAWAARWAALEHLGGGLQQMLDYFLESGELATLLDHVGDPAAPFTLARLDARFAAGTDYAGAAAGTGAFVLEPSSFVPGSGEPRGLFAATLAGDSLEASGGSLVTPVPLSSTDAMLLPVHEARIDAVRTASLRYEGGLSGAVRIDDIFAGMNAIAASPACACLGLTGPLYVLEDGRWSSTCVSDAAMLCPDEVQAPCRTVAGRDVTAGQSCPMQPLLWNDAGDLDLDGDGRLEALSFGMLWKGVPAPTVHACVPSATDSCEPCAGDSDCAAFQPADRCGGRFACVEGNCELDPATRPDCSATQVPLCAVAACEPATGACVPVPVLDETPCQPDPCTAGVCSGGQCVGQEPVLCDDGNDCTEDGCDALTGCYALFLEGGSCVTGDPCVVSAACTEGGCEPQAFLDCAEGNPCVEAYCDPGTGGCVFDFGLHDGVGCGSEPCEQGVCTAGLCETAPVRCPPVGCDDYACAGGACQPAGTLPGAAVCGDGLRGCGEECDDADLDPGDGCDAACGLEFCGDGIVQAGLGEVCDDANAWGGDGCRFDCLGLELCGDGLLDRNEQCDDGNLDDTDGCTADCRRTAS